MLRVFQPDFPIQVIQQRLADLKLADVQIGRDGGALGPSNGVSYEGKLQCHKIWQHLPLLNASTKSFYGVNWSPTNFGDCLG